MPLQALKDSKRATRAEKKKFLILRETIKQLVNNLQVYTDSCMRKQKQKQKQISVRNKPSWIINLDLVFTK